jgi:hypothetical protein
MWPFTSIRGGEFLDQLSNYWLLRTLIHAVSYLSNYMGLKGIAEPCTALQKKQQNAEHILLMSK